MSAQTTTPNTLNEQEAADGWKLLFDGKTSAGWRGFQREDFPDGWQIVDGTLHRADKAGDIITVDQFEDFELSIDWKVAGPGNSGIMYHVSEEEDKPWKTGPEYQILNNDVHRDGGNPLTRAGSCYALYAPTKEMCKPVGEWNTAKIVARGNHIEHWLNGEKIVSYEKYSDDWEKRVAESKFSKFPKYGRTVRGHINLQDHSDPVWYRNIKIRPL